jgi:hypothetical protein
VPSPTGGYEAGHYVASFGGFVPAEDPQITGMVVVDNTPDYGAAASAPTFATIARDALQQFQIRPLPKQPPVPGVPLATTQSATGAGEVAGAPLPGLQQAPTVAKVTPSGASGQGATTTTVPEPATTTASPTTTVVSPRSRSSPTTR